MIPSNFCSRAFNEINFDVNGTISPCCVIRGKKYESVDDFLNSDYLRSIQTDLNNNIQTKECKSCWKLEEIGAWSNRLHEPSRDHIDGSHLKFSNVCNFKCRMCNSYSSSAIGIEEGIKNPVVSTFSNPKIKKYFYKKLLPNLKLINISGGEPLLCDDHLEFLQVAYLINPKVHLSYNSNMSITSYRGVEFSSLWKKYEKVSITASIDGYKESQDYQRFGSVWNKIENNLIIFKDYVKDIHCTLTIYNIFHIPKLIKWCIDNNFIIRFYYVGQLAESPLTLPESEKQKVMNEFKSLKNLSEDLSKEIRDSLLKPLQKTPGNLQNLNLQFKSKTERLDNLRNQSFIKINPQFKDWYERI